MKQIRSRTSRWFPTLVAVVLLTLALGVFAAPASAAIVCVNPGPLDQLLDCTPTVQLRVGPVGGPLTDLTSALTITGDGKRFQISLPFTVLTALAALQLGATTQADPFINYAFLAQNFAATDVEYSLDITQPFVGGPYTTLFSSHSGSTTDSGNAFVSPNGVVTVGTPTWTFVHQPLVNGVPVDGLNEGCTVMTAPGGSGNCPPSGLETTVPIATGEAGTFGVEVHFTLSPGDIYTLNGFVELRDGVNGGVIPEPATALLITSGVVALAAIRRRRQSPSRD